MRRLALVLLALPVALTGCSSSDDGPELPEESAFAEGTCRQAAPDVVAVGEALRELGDGPRVASGVQNELRDAQDRLFALSEGAEPEYGPALADLVEKIGLVRIRAVGRTYEPALGASLETSYEEVLRVCGAAERD